MSSFAYPQEAAAPSARTISNALDQLAFATMCLFVFCLTFEKGKGTTYLPQLGVVAFALVFMSKLVSPRPKRLWDLHYWMLAFAAWSAATLFWTMDWNATVARALTYVQLLVLAWLVWTLASSESRVIYFMHAYIIGTFVCIYGTFHNLMIGRSYGQLDDLEGPKSARYMMTGMNPNDVGLLLAPGLAISLYLLARRKGNPVLCWAQVVLGITTILLSGSRGALLAASAAVLMFPFVFASLPRWQKVFAAMACGCAIGFALYFVPLDTWTRIFRLGTDLTQGTMTHRTQIWSASMDVFRDHPLLGVGADAHPAAVVKMIARPMVAHNTFLSVLVELGIIGGLIFAGLILAALVTAMRMRGVERTLWMVILASWCIGACGATWEYRKATWFLFGLIAAHGYVMLKQSGWRLKPGKA